MVYLCKLCDEFLSPGKPGMFVKLINMKDTITNDEFGKEFGEQETKSCTRKLLLLKMTRKTLAHVHIWAHIEAVFASAFQATPAPPTPVCCSTTRREGTRTWRSTASS